MKNKQYSIAPCHSSIRNAPLLPNETTTSSFPTAPHLHPEPKRPPPPPQPKQLPSPTETRLHNPTITLYPPSLSPLATMPRTRHVSDLLACGPSAAPGTSVVAGISLHLHPVASDSARAETFAQAPPQAVRPVSAPRKIVRARAAARHAAYPRCRHRFHHGY